MTPLISTTGRFNVDLSTIATCPKSPGCSSDAATFDGMKKRNRFGGGQFETTP